MVLGAGDEFMRCFSTCFALLGLKLLFGSKDVTIGSVLLLACISGAVSSAWTGGGGAWVEVNVAHLFNSLPNAGGFTGGAAALGMLRTLVCRIGVYPTSWEGEGEDCRDM